MGTLAEWVAIRPLEKSGAVMMSVASLALSFLLENLLRFSFGNDLKGFELALLRDVTFGPLRIGPQQRENVRIRGDLINLKAQIAKLKSAQSEAETRLAQIEKEY